MRLIQKAPIGTVLVELDSQECLMLKLLICPESQTKEVWIKLWETVSDYEALHFFCKDFMPSAVARLNKLGLLDELVPLIRGNRHFIRGLPKFIWSKNQLILREARQVTALFSNAGLDLAFVKGVGRMLEIGGSELYRISRDIDILVPWNQFDQSIDLLLKNSWEFKEHLSKGEMITGRINAITLYHPIQRVEIDLHRSLFHDLGGDYLPLMNEIWSRTKMSDVNNHSHILSRRDQLLVAINNTFNFFNWETSQFCKYIYDVAKILQEMDEGELSALPQDLAISKLSFQFVQILKILEGLEVRLPWKSLSKFREMMDLENSLVNYSPAYKNKINIQGIKLLTLIGWCGTIRLFCNAIKKNPLHISTYFYFLFEVRRVISRLIKNAYCSALSINQQAGSSIYKNRLRWYLFS